ncbi:MAG: hypothetical protein ACRDLS_16335 [Solirubrobacteraceae bacterium]
MTATMRAPSSMSPVPAAQRFGRERSRAASMRVLREALWFIWEEPRLPRPLVASKYPKPYPWSPRARATFDAHAGKRPRGGWGLVIEHLYPRELLVAYLLDEGAHRDAADAVDILTARLMAAVVTRDDDRQLPTRAQSARPWDDYASDPWLRYRAAGLQLEDFAPVP